jgi:hypothetical protein
MRSLAVMRRPGWCSTTGAEVEGHGHGLQAVVYAITGEQ